MTYKLIIFDLDGVILNSKESNRHYYNEILYSIEKRYITDFELDYVHSETADNALNFLFKGDEKKILHARQKAKEIRYVDFTKYLFFEDYAQKTLDKLNGRIEKAICTNRTDTMPILIDMYGLKKWFDTFITALDVSHPKPHPEGLLKIIELKGVSLSQAIYVGDTKIDEEASKNANIDFIAYKNKNLSAKYHINRFDEIENILNLTHQ